MEVYVRSLRDEEMLGRQCLVCLRDVTQITRERQKLAMLLEAVSQRLGIVAWGCDCVCTPGDDNAQCGEAVFFGTVYETVTGKKPPDPSTTPKSASPPSPLHRPTSATTAVPPADLPPPFDAIHERPSHAYLEPPDDWGNRSIDSEEPVSQLSAGSTAIREYMALIRRRVGVMDPLISVDDDLQPCYGLQAPLPQMQPQQQPQQRRAYSAVDVRCVSRSSSGCSGIRPLEGDAAVAAERCVDGCDAPPARRDSDGNFWTSWMQHFAEPGRSKLQEAFGRLCHNKESFLMDLQYETPQGGEIRSFKVGGQADPACPDFVWGLFQDTTSERMRELSTLNLTQWLQRLVETHFAGWGVAEIQDTGTITQSSATLDALLGRTVQGSSARVVLSSDALQILRAHGSFKDHPQELRVAFTGRRIVHRLRLTAFVDREDPALVVFGLRVEETRRFPPPVNTRCDDIVLPIDSPDDLQLPVSSPRMPIVPPRFDVLGSGDGAGLVDQPVRVIIPPSYQPDDP